MSEQHPDKQATPPEQAARATALLPLLRRHFMNRTDRVAILAPWGKPSPVEIVGSLDNILLGHLLGDAAPEVEAKYTNNGGSGTLNGRFRVGSYAPSLDDTTLWLCLDFDGPGHSNALANPLAAAIKTMDNFIKAGLQVYLERSGGGNGWHLWCFFEQPIPAGKARDLGHLLAPKHALLVDGQVADATANRGIEVFPKQKSRKSGYGNFVWLPWWQGAPSGANIFYQYDEAGLVEPVSPTEFATTKESQVDEILATMVPASTMPSKDAPPPRAAPSARAGDANPAYAEWRLRALDALPLEAVYGDLLTGKKSGAGWLECRDPSSPTGDQNPSAGVADGTGDAERGSFHSFISGKTISVFDFLMMHRGAPDFLAAVARVAQLSGVPEPRTSSSTASGTQRSGPHETRHEEEMPSSPAESSAPSPPQHQRPLIAINGRPLDNLVADAWCAIHAANRHNPSMFLRDGKLVRLAHGSLGQRIEPMNEVSVLSHLADVAYWGKITRDKATYGIPNKDVARVILEMPNPSLPWLEMVVNTPVFAQDGSLVSTPGYNSRAHVWYEPPRGLTVPPIPERPSADVVEQARALLLDELLIDFPFVDAASRAHMVGAMLLPFARRLIQGPTPIHLFEAPTEGSGKGLCVNVVAMTATGAPACGGSLPENEDEVRKRLMSELSTGRPILMLDNADNKRQLDSPALASATTMWPIWTDRLLNNIKMLSAPNEVLWVLTANNPRLSRELARRCVSIRIDPRVDRPWLRTGFKHPNLLDWARDNRASLVHAALVLVQNWVAKGRPTSTSRLGTFERWSEIIGGILSSANIEGFLGNMGKLCATSDSEGTMWREFIGAWWKTHHGTPVRVSDLVELCIKGELMAPVLGDGNERSQSTRLGMALQNARDRTFGNWRIEDGARDPVSNRPTYRLIEAGESSRET